MQKNIPPECGHWTKIVNYYEEDIIMTFTIETITPQIAAEYLTHNVHNNRSLRRKCVEMLACDMANGAFRCTHQGIAFDDNGNLIDGQHRLNAILLANVPVQMMVARGLSTDMINTVDKGATRSLHDTMSITYTGVDEKSCAIRHRDVLNAISQLISLSLQERRKVSQNDVMIFFEENEEACINLYRICRECSGKKNAVQMAACLCALMYGVPADTIRKFNQVYRDANITGCTNYNVQIVLSWRHYIDGLKAKHMRLNSYAMFYTMQFVLWNFANNTRLQKTAPVNEEKYTVRESVSRLLARRVADAE